MRICRLFSGTVTGILMSVLHLPAAAETCPATAEIIERRISNLYEWTVEEGTSLDDLLSVNRLFSVRILNGGEFVSCQYTTRKWPVKLDAKPEVGGCRVIQTAGNWEETPSGHQVCRQKNLYACEFRITCDRD